ncbi:hypothetical protein [Aquamicrobium terrae]
MDRHPAFLFLVPCLAISLLDRAQHAAEGVDPGSVVMTVTLLLGLAGTFRA